LNSLAIAIVMALKTEKVGVQMPRWATEALR